MKNMFFAQNKTGCPAWQMSQNCWQYDNISLNLATLTGFTTGMQEIRFSADGTKLYNTVNFRYRIYQFNLPTAWVLTGVTYTKFKDFQTQTGSKYIQGFDFSSGGTMLFFSTREISGGSSQYSKIYKYNLSTAWDIGSATYDSNSAGIYGNFKESIQVRNSGTKLYTYGSNDKFIAQYSMSTAYDVTTIVYDNKKITGATGTFGDGIYMKSDGTRLYNSFNMKQYNLSTAWDVSTATTGGTFVYAGTGNAGIHFKSDGTRFFRALWSTTSGQDYVYQFSKK